MNTETIPFDPEQLACLHSFYNKHVAMLAVYEGYTTSLEASLLALIPSPKERELYKGNLRDIFNLNVKHVEEFRQERSVFPVKFPAEEMTREAFMEHLDEEEFDRFSLKQKLTALLNSRILQGKCVRA